MKNWFTTNLSLKILSVLFAISLWIIVVNISDPVTTKTFKNIPVSFKNESVLSEAGLVYQVLDGSDMVTFTVRAKRSVIESLANADFNAVADFSERISENSVPVKVSALKYEDQILDIDLMKNTVKIAVEEKVSKVVPVNLHVVGNTSEGFTVGNTKVAPAEVTLSGPQSLIGNIDNMSVVLDVANANEDISTKLDGQILDKNGNVVSDNRIFSDVNQFEVTAELLHTKSVDLDFSVEGNVKDGYRYVGMEYKPTTILLAGEVEDLEKISTIVFPPSELNIEGADNNVVKTVDVSKYVPNNLTVVNENEKEVTVTLTVVNLDTRRLSYPVTKINVLNTPSGMDVSFEGKLNIDVVLLGLREELERFSADNLNVSVDVKGLTEGVHNVQLKIDANTDGIEVAETSYIDVSLHSSRVEITQPPVETPAVTHGNDISDVLGTEPN